MYVDNLISGAKIAIAEEIRSQPQLEARPKLLFLGENPQCDFQLSASRSGQSTLAPTTTFQLECLHSEASS